MAVDDQNNISLTGMDWSNKVREVSLDRHLWHRLVNWRQSRESALKWVQIQITLFSKRHPTRETLSQIIASIAFVELARADNQYHHQKMERDKPASGQLDDDSPKTAQSR